MHLSWRKLAARAWNLVPADFERLAVAVTADSPGRPAPALNKICDRRDWDDLGWRRAFDDLGYLFDPGKVHRKEWEFAHAVYGLRKLERLAPQAVALGLGSGHEPIVYFLARRLAAVVATDLYEGDFADEEADPRMLTRPEWFAPYAYPLDRLRVHSMDATRIGYPDESFDVVFSLSSIEHFGARAAQARTLREIHRVLRPGGVAVLTTEVILNTLGFHGDYFRLAEVVDRLVPESGLRLIGGPFRFETSRETLDSRVQLPRERDRLPHLVCRRWRTTFTSGAFFLERPVPDAATPIERRARLGSEREAELPVLLDGWIEPSARSVAAKPGEVLALRCEVGNRGNATWDRAARDGVGVVRLGAHLRAADGAMLERELARADLPHDLAPGERAEVIIALTAPPTPGRYVIELDMVKEGIAWFAAAGGSAPVPVPLEVVP